MPSSTALGGCGRGVVAVAVVVTVAACMAVVVAERGSLGFLIAQHDGSEQIAHRVFPQGGGARDKTRQARQHRRLHGGLAVAVR